MRSELVVCALVFCSLDGTAACLGPPALHPPATLRRSTRRTAAATAPRWLTSATESRFVIRRLLMALILPPALAQVVMTANQENGPAETVSPMAKAKEDKIAETSVIVCHHRRQGRILCWASLDRTRQSAFCRGSSAIPVLRVAPSFLLVGLCGYPGPWTIAKEEEDQCGRRNGHKLHPGADRHANRGSPQRLAAVVRPCTLPR